MRFQSYLVATVLTAAFVTPSLVTTSLAADAPNPHAVSCKLIKTPAQLQAMAADLTATYCLAKDLDMAGVDFDPIGPGGTPFSGNFFGNNHVISNLTINFPAIAAFGVGLFGTVSGGQIQDVTLRNVSVTDASGVPTGALIGSVSTSPTQPVVVARIHVSGSVNCNGSCGGIVGSLLANVTLTQSSSTANVASVRGGAGGAVGFLEGTIDRSYATGRVSCIGGSQSCVAGGLSGNTTGSITRSFATGPVLASGLTPQAGGLVGNAGGANVNLNRSFATGPVTVGANDNATAGGLVAVTFNNAAKIDQTFATGKVFGGNNVGAALGGLIGKISSGTPTVTSSFWDTQQTGQATSAGGAGAVGQTTAQLRANLPSGFGRAWAINKTLSYPFLNDPDIDFASPLAMLIVGLKPKPYTLLPLGQLDKSLYNGATAHIEEASRAAVFAMIGRAIGQTDDINSLKNVKIDRYWNDAAQTTTLRTPLSNLITIAAPRNIAAAASLANVVAKLNSKQLVILQGTFNRSNGTTGTHFMLATLFTKNNDGSTSTVVANDPFTGQQVEIDPDEKNVVVPSNHPLAGFKVTAFETVTLAD